MFCKSWQCHFCPGYQGLISSSFCCKAKSAPFCHDRQCHFACFCHGHSWICPSSASICGIPRFSSGFTHVRWNVHSEFRGQLHCTAWNPVRWKVHHLLWVYCRPSSYSNAVSSLCESPTSSSCLGMSRQKFTIWASPAKCPHFPLTQIYKYFGHLKDFMLWNVTWPKSSTKKSMWGSQPQEIRP